MARYFIELAYKGKAYSGFQVQENAATVQSEVEKAFAVLHRRQVELTGSSRTDAGVHALQNYFHFDSEEAVHPQFVYKMNAILPRDVVIRSLHLMPEGAHSRFDALSRLYRYRIHWYKNPFLQEHSYFYPYKLNMNDMQEAAARIAQEQDFFGFAKTNSQVSNYRCHIMQSYWAMEGDEMVYTIEANRFLRGMVRLVTATLLRVGRGKMHVKELDGLFGGGQKCGHSVPAHGLYLCSVNYPENYFP